MALDDLAFVIDRAPAVMGLAGDLHEHLIQVPVPVPVSKTPPVAGTALAHLACKHRPEPVPLEPDGFMAQIDAALEPQILDAPQAQREADVHHDHQADYFGRCVETAKRGRGLALELQPMRELAAPPTDRQIGLTVPAGFVIRILKGQRGNAPVKFNVPAILCRRSSPEYGKAHR